MAQADVSSYPKFAAPSGGLDIAGFAQQGAQLQGRLLSNTGQMLQNERSQQQLREAEFNWQRQKAIAPIMQQAVRPDGTMDYQKLVMGMASNPHTAALVPDFVESAGRRQLLDAQVVNAQLAARAAQGQMTAQFFASMLPGAIERVTGPDGQVQTRVNITPEQVRAHATSPAATAAGITPAAAANFVANYSRMYSTDPQQAGMSVLRAGMFALKDTQMMEMALGKQQTIRAPGELVHTTTDPIGGTTAVTGRTPISEKDPKFESEIEGLVNSARNADGTYGPQRTTREQFEAHTRNVKGGMIVPRRDDTTGQMEWEDRRGGELDTGVPTPPVPMLPRQQTPGQGAGVGMGQPGLPSAAADPNAPPLPGSLPGSAPPGAQTGGVPSGLTTPPALSAPPTGNLYSDASQGSGVIPAIQSFLRGTAPQAPVVTGAVPFVGPLIASGMNAAGAAVGANTDAGARAVERRTALEMAQRKFTMAMLNSSRAPTYEQKLIEQNFGISPSVWRSAASLQDRMREIDRNLRRELAEQQDVLKQRGSTPEMRKRASERSQAIQSFLRELNVPAGASASGVPTRQQKIDALRTMDAGGGL